MATGGWTARRATVDDAEEIARLLHDFNTEFDTPSPGAAVLGPRLRALLGTDGTFAVVAGAQPAAVGLVTLRTNVWYDGPVALLDELYVVPHLRGRGIGTALIGLVLDEARSRGVALVEVNVDEADTDAQRFYERHGFLGVEPDTGDRAFSYSMELAPPEG